MRPQKWALLLSALSFAAISTGGAAREPTKRTPIRRGYDFSRPEPGEILPNPKEGVGAPPQLRAYVTVKDMASQDHTASKASKSSQELEKPAEAKPTTSAAVSAAPAAQQPESKPVVPNPELWRSSPTALMARHLETALAKQIAALGLDGPFAYQPSPAAQTDPKIAESEKRVWKHLVESLAVSWRSWQAVHAIHSPQRPSDLPQGAQNGGLLQRDLAAAQATPPTAAGQIILKGSSPNVIGDLPDVAPR